MKPIFVESTRLCSTESARWHVWALAIDVALQSPTSPVLDYYGEKIDSLHEYRKWLRDQNKYRRKDMLILVLFYFTCEGFALPTPALDASGFSQVALTRTVPEIIWSCLTTIFACTWVAVHPNIPSRHDSYQDLLWRRVKILAVALIAPEYIILWAANQLWSSKRAVKQLHNYSGCSDWTLTHGMFLIMGGFMLTKDSGEVIGSEIMDRSKGDVVSKTLVLVQTTWFIAQVISRALQHLPITELEITTVAFASLNILTYILWWTKPLDVHHPILLSMRPRQVVAEASELSDTETCTLQKTPDIPFNNRQFQSPLQSVAGFSTEFFEARFFSDAFVSTRFALSQIDLSLPLVEPGILSDGGIEKDSRTDGENARRGRKKKKKDMRSSENPFYPPYRLGDNLVASDVTSPRFRMFPPHYDFYNSSAGPDNADITDAETSQLSLAVPAQAADRNSLEMYHCKSSVASSESICADGTSPVVDRKEDLPRPEITVVNSDSGNLHRLLPLPLLEHGLRYINRGWTRLRLSLFAFVSPWWRESNATSVYTMSHQSLPSVTTRTSLDTRLDSTSFPTLEFTARVPTFYGGRPLHSYPIVNGSLYPTSLEMLLGAIFGAIHCVAWTFQLPLNVERVLWRTTSLCMTLVPLVFMSVTVLVWVSLLTLEHPSWKRFIRNQILFIYKWTNLVSFIAYIVARLATFVLAFILLRDLPLAALQEVQWTTFIPHV
ncbi:hypothetical protein BDP27DRAFT_1424533 [Rhodocollybia butyracea]|uniref:Uncharacterized protein n=1 Tax=Rhodocollybia butyracea TaxID=206335 RepID=A0A9P5PHI5_9AGAR|nr:hypothetical protein BDP27DRAFT_1424533 [Rhodocollybia butyracea]